MRAVELHKNCCNLCAADFHPNLSQGARDKKSDRQNRAVEQGSQVKPAISAGFRLKPHQVILQPAPESARALAATPITLFSLFSTTRR